MDAVVGRPLRELLSDVALPGDLAEALLPTTGKQNRVGDVLELVVAYERADWLAVESGCNKLGLVDAILTLPRYYQDALSWAMTTTLTGRS
jgi:c-di-GMP-related signal transduction protein